MPKTHNLFDELTGLVEYLENGGHWSTNEIQQWSNRCTAWIAKQIKLNETTLKNTNQTETENNQ